MVQVDAQITSTNLDYNFLGIHYRPKAKRSKHLGHVCENTFLTFYWLVFHTILCYGHLALNSLIRSQQN